MLPHLVALATLVSLAAAAPNLQVRDSFANFFDDENCQTNGGAGVDMNNPGCLSEPGRGSVYIPNYLDGNFNTFWLLGWQDDGCPNLDNDQVSAPADFTYKFNPTGYCYKLDDKWAKFSSYAFTKTQPLLDCQDPSHTDNDGCAALGQDPQ